MTKGVLYCRYEDGFDIGSLVSVDPETGIFDCRRALWDIVSIADINPHEPPERQYLLWEVYQFEIEWIEKGHTRRIVDLPRFQNLLAAKIIAALVAGFLQIVTRP